MNPERTYWRSEHLNYDEDEPLFLALLKYHQKQDRIKIDTDDPRWPQTNLISSRTNVKGVHLPILDLDLPRFRLVKSTTSGHAHLYCEKPVGRLRWLLFMFGCKQVGLIENGFFWWSIRRGGNFVRPTGIEKTSEENLRSEATYGMFRKIKK